MKIKENTKKKEKRKKEKRRPTISQGGGRAARPAALCPLRRSAEHSPGSSVALPGLWVALGGTGWLWVAFPCPGARSLFSRGCTSRTHWPERQPVPISQPFPSIVRKFLDSGK